MTSPASCTASTLVWCDQVECGVVTYDACVTVCPGCGMVGYPIRPARPELAVLSSGVEVGDLLRRLAATGGGS
jgi:hypothetical protein